MLKKIKYIAQKTVKEDVTRLLITAFPTNERPPVAIFFNNFKKDNNILLAFYDNDEFIGFTALTFYLDICYIFFLAVTPTHQNKGYGSQIIEIIKNDYFDYILLLAYEEVDPKYEDYYLRNKREKFYYKHGFLNNNLKTNEWGIVFQTAYLGKRKVSFIEYKEIFKLGFGVNAIKNLKKVE